jgi:hypothetical protein
MVLILIIAIGNFIFLSGFLFISGGIPATPETWSIVLICYGAAVAGLIIATVLCVRGNTKAGLRAVACVLPGLFIASIGFVLVGEIIKVVYPYFGIEVPCRFRWPPCDL